MNIQMLMSLAGIDNTMLEDFTEKGKIVVDRFERLEKKVYEIDYKLIILNSNFDVFFKKISEIKENEENKNE